MRAGQRPGSLTEAQIARLDNIGMEWDAFSVKWEQNYLEALKYYQENGDLMVPAGYKTESGFALGAWIRTLRRTRRGLTNSRAITEEQIKRLDAIGMYWGDCNDNQWLKGYCAAERYYRQNGDLNVPVAYQSPDGVVLGKWVRRQRYAGKANAKTNSRLTQERVQLLRQIGLDLTQQAG